MTIRPIIRWWSAPGIGSVNTYWIEGEDSVVVIDGQRELSKARQVLTEISATNKPIAAVILTHPHPDHFGGIGVFAPVGSGIPIYGSQQTRDNIAEDRFGLVKASHEVVKDDFPAEVTLPDHIIADGEVIRVAGLELHCHEWGEGEAECMTVVQLPAAGALFCADLVQDKMTAFLMEGRSAAWLSQLERLEASFPELAILYPGHGEPGAPNELVVRQSEYLKYFRHLVAGESSAGALLPGGEQRIIDAMEARYPGYVPVAAIPDLLTKDIEPVAKEITGG